MLKTSQVRGKPTQTKPQQKAPAETEKETHDDQLRKGRIMAVVVLLVFAALIALFVWLAASSPPSDPSSFDYMM